MAPAGAGYITKVASTTADGVYCGATAPVDGAKITKGTMSVVLATNSNKLLAQMEWELTLAAELGTGEVEMFTCIQNG